MTPDTKNVLLSDKCQTCVHWKKLKEITSWGNCINTELYWFKNIMIPNYFGCLWYQPILPEKLKKYQIKIS